MTLTPPKTKLHSIKNTIPTKKNIFCFFITKWYHILKAFIMKKYRHLSFEFIKYVIVGGICTIVDWGAFYIFTHLLATSYHIALPFSFALGAITHFFLNRFFTFNYKEKSSKRQLSVYITILILSFAANYGLMHLFVSHKINVMLSRVFTTGLMLFVNFLLHKLLTFNHRLYQPK